MLKDIVYAQALDEHRLRIRFEDGIEGDVDVRKLVDFAGVFAPLSDPAYFSRVTVEAGSVAWPNGADLDPVVLYSIVSGKPIPEYSPTTAAH